MFEFIKNIFREKAFALYITDNYIQAVQVGGMPWNPRFKAFGHRDIASGIVKNGIVLKEDLLAKEIVALLASTSPNPITEKKCYFSFPENHICEHIFYLSAALSDDDFKKALNNLVATTIPISMSELKGIYHVWTCGNTKVVSLTCVRRKVISGYYDFLKKVCGFEPVFFEPEYLSLLRNIPKKFNSDRGILLVDIRDGKIFWFNLWKKDVLGRGSFVINQAEFEKFFPLMVSDLQASFKFFEEKTGRKVEEIVICGPPNQVQTLTFQQKLKQHFNIFTTINSQYRWGSDQFKIPCGLALKSFDTDIDSEINLLQD
jgi:hypothetical protein